MGDSSGSVGAGDMDVQDMLGAVREAWFASGQQGSAGLGGVGLEAGLGGLCRGKLGSGGMCLVSAGSWGLNGVWVDCGGKLGSEWVLRGAGWEAGIWGGSVCHRGTWV